MKSFYKIFILFIAFIASTASAMTRRSSVEKVHIGVLSGPSGIPMAKQMENDKIGTTEASYEVFAGAALLLPKLIKGEIDIGFLPPNMAAKVYNTNNKAIVTAGIAGNGMLYLITKDKNLNSLSDLKGKTISIAGQGATPDYMIRYLLDKANISTDGEKDSVTLDFSIPNAEIAPALLSGKIQYALVPEPFATVATTKNADVIRAIDIQELYNKVQNTNSSYPMTVIVVNSTFAEEHADLVREFLKDYKKASEWTVKNPEEAGQLVDKNNIGLAGNIAAKAIPNSAYTFATAKDGRKALESILNVFLTFNEVSIGGKLPDEGFYFK